MDPNPETAAGELAILDEQRDLPAHKHAPPFPFDLVQAASLLDQQRIVGKPGAPDDEALTELNRRVDFVAAEMAADRPDRADASRSTPRTPDRTT